MKRFFRKDKSSSSSPQSVVNAWESTEETTPQAVVVSEKTEITGPSREQTPVMMNGDKQDNSDNENPQSSVPEVGPASTSIEMPPATPEKKKHKPSKARLAFRFWQVLAAVGAFGFQVGATPYSGHQIPFSRVGLLYYVYAICWLSFLWSLFMIHVYLTRRFGHGGKVKRPVSFLMDAFLAALFGVGSFYEIAMYKCPPGYYDGWCNFFNTGIFFAVSLFATYVIHALWDVFGGMSCIRRKEDD